MLLATNVLSITPGGVDSTTRSFGLHPKLPKHHSASSEFFQHALLKLEGLGTVTIFAEECMFEEGIGALGAYCKEKKWSLFTPRPKLHMQQEIMNL